MSVDADTNAPAAAPAEEQQAPVAPETSSQSESEVVELPTGDAKEGKQHFLANIVSSVTGVASRLYDKSSTFVKTKSPSFVKVTIEKVENNVQNLAQHPTAQSVVTRVTGYGHWAIDKADGKIDQYYNKLQERRAAFLESELGQRVNTSLTQSLQTVNDRVLDPSAEFYRGSMDKFKELQALAVSRGEEGKVTVEQFVNGLREKLGQAWNEKLAEPAKAFHAAATENVTAVRERLGQEWENRVKPHLKPITQPASKFYDSAAHSYTALYETSKSGTVTLTEFVAGIRVQLGRMWSENLMQPAQHLFQQFNSKTDSDNATETSDESKRSS